jgi:hypothetical protein
LEIVPGGGMGEGELKFSFPNACIVTKMKFKKNFLVRDIAALNEAQKTRWLS